MSQHFLLTINQTANVVSTLVVADHTITYPCTLTNAKLKIDTISTGANETSNSIMYVLQIVKQGFTHQSISQTNNTPSVQSPQFVLLFHGGVIGRYALVADIISDVKMVTDECFYGNVDLQVGDRIVLTADPNSGDGRRAYGNLSFELVV